MKSIYQTENQCLRPSRAEQVRTVDCGTRNEAPKMPEDSAIRIPNSSFESFADPFGRIPLKVVPKDGIHGKGLLAVSRRTLSGYVNDATRRCRLKTEVMGKEKFTRAGWLRKFIESQQRF